jgi:hypothetical protein
VGRAFAGGPRAIAECDEWPLVSRYRDDIILIAQTGCRAEGVVVEP